MSPENTRSENAKTVVAMALRCRSALERGADLGRRPPSAWSPAVASPAAAASSAPSWMMGLLPP